jgi:hypothetical protein
MDTKPHPCPFCLEKQGWSQQYYTLSVHIAYKHPEYKDYMMQNSCDNCDGVCTDCVKDSPGSIPSEPEIGE